MFVDNYAPVMAAKPAGPRAQRRIDIVGCQGLGVV